jgi:hypothetical protein
MVVGERAPTKRLRRHGDPTGCGRERSVVTFRVNPWTYVVATRRVRMETTAGRSETRRIRLLCDCGDWLESDADAYRLTCGCGRVFAVTVTDVGRVAPSTED